jgi:hypothetical protein
MPHHRDLSLAEWTVLAVVDDEPAHGFAAEVSRATLEFLDGLTG